MENPSLLFKFVISDTKDTTPSLRCTLEINIPGLPTRQISLKNESQIEDISQWAKLLDENVEILYGTEFEQDNWYADEIEEGLKLCEVIDMVQDIADSHRIKKAEEELAKRQAL